MSSSPTVTEATREALLILRDPTQFKWYAVFLLMTVAYVYAVEVERRRWDVVCAGLALWFADWLNEIVNALVLHFTGYAPLWATTGPTAYLILVGLTLEITFMFAIFGIVFVKQLPPDPAMRILGMPNRPALALLFSLIAVGIEVLLHGTGMFHWAYWFWNVPFVPLIVIFGYLWFFVVAAWVYDLPTDAQRVRVVAAMAAFDLALGIVCGPVLGWI